MQEEWRRGESDADAVVGAARFVWSAARGGCRHACSIFGVGGEINKVEHGRSSLGRSRGIQPRRPRRGDQLRSLTQQPSASHTPLRGQQRPHGHRRRPPPRRSPEPRASMAGTPSSGRSSRGRRGAGSPPSAPRAPVASRETSCARPAPIPPPPTHDRRLFGSARHGWPAPAAGCRARRAWAVARRSAGRRH